MTTMWREADGHWEGGCGCEWLLIESERRFVVTKRSPKCRKPHPHAGSASPAASEEKK